MIERIFSMPLYISMPIVLVGYSMACLGAGILILKLYATEFDRMERVSAGTLLATGFILGQGILASLWLLLSLGGWLSIEVVGSLCLLFAAAVLYVGRNLFSRFIKQLTSIWRELRADTWGWQLVAGLTIILALLWVTSLGRPLAGDGSAFYFALGKFIALSHHLAPLPGYELFTNIGLQGELHFAALMVLHSPEAAKLFSWPTILMAGIMLSALGRLTGMGRRGQWLTLGMLFSSSAVIWLSGDGKVDLFAVAFGLAAYYWAVQIRFTHSRVALLLTGLFSGFSMVSKLSYAPVMVPTIAILVLWAYAAELRVKDGKWRPVLKSFLTASAIILAGLILAFIPHFVKNGVLFNNPISPIGSANSGWLSQTWYGPEVTRYILFTYPLALTYGTFWAQYGNLSALILAFFPLLIFLPRPRSFFSSPLVMITLSALVGIVTWAFYNPSVFAPRYILAALLLLILLPARSAEYMSLNEQKPRLLAMWILVSAIIVLASSGTYFLDKVFFPRTTVQYLTGATDECERDGEPCGAIKKINLKAEPGSRVFLASFQRYWFRGDLLQCLLSDQDRISGDQSITWLMLYERGFNILLIDTSTHAYILESLNLENPPNWVQLKLLDEIPPYSIYQLSFEKPPSTAQRVACQRLPSSSVWELTPEGISTGKKEQ